MGSLIGIQTHVYNYQGRNYEVMPKNYVKFFKRFGKIVPVGLSVIRKDLDLLVLTGGADVDPKRYGEEPSSLCGPKDIRKEWFDIFCLPKYMETKIPIFGICRGLLDGLLSRVI